MGDTYIYSCALKGFTSLPDTVPIMQSVELTPDEDTEPYIFPEEGYDGINIIAIIEGGTLIPENIREGVTIFGVTGTYSGD